jgi:hypothetical protein
LPLRPTVKRVGLPRKEDAVNLCTTCNQDFASVALFDSHRVGAHAYDWSLEREDGRRCLHANEMAARGWTLDARGRWHDPMRAKETREHFALREAA